MATRFPPCRAKRHVHYHAEKARGGVGLIIFEAIRLHPSSIGRAQGVLQRAHRRLRGQRDQSVAVPLNVLQAVRAAMGPAERVVAFRPD
jgi:hypothetical protein